MNNPVYFEQDVNELVIVIGNDKFRINENEIKHFINGTKLVEKHNIDSEAFYKFVTYLVSICNEWKNFFVKSISPESEWSILIKTNNNGAKRYAGIEYCPNNWQELYNNFVAFVKNIEIVTNIRNKEIQQQPNNEYEIEQYLNFTDFNNLNITDDETEDYDLVCGIRIETNYVGGTVEQLNLYDIPKGSVFHFNYSEAEIINITKDEIVLRTDNTIELSKIQSKVTTEEKNKIDLHLKVNEFITGWSTMPIPLRVQYKMKVLYVRKKQQLEY